MKLDKKRIAHDSDPVTVARFLGMQMRKTGSRYSILCPDHSDHHFGSCYLTESGYHCFSCGSHGDVFQLVRSFTGCNFQEAMETVAETLGGVDEYVMSGEALEREKAIYKELKKIPPKEDLRLILLDPPSACWVNIGVTYNLNPELAPDERAIWEPDDDLGYNVIQKCVDRHPLLTFLRDDEEGFREMIRNKAFEAKGYYETLKEQFLQEETQVLLTSCIRRCEDLAIEYGGQIEKKNMFGSLKRGSHR